MNQCEMSVNDAHLQWIENPSVSVKACQGCGIGTKGRAQIHSSVQVFGGAPFCIECAMDAVMKLGTPGASVLRRLFRGARAS